MSSDPLQTRYKPVALPVTIGGPRSEDRGSLTTESVCDYVHLNPARARLVGREHKLSSFRWSSFRDYLQPRRKRPVWLRVDRLLGEHGIAFESREGRRGWRQEELKNRRKGDKNKVRIAVRLRQETTMTLKWILSGAFEDDYPVR